MFRVVRKVKAGNYYGMGVEEILHPVSNKIVNAMHIQLVSKSFLNTIDHGQLCLTLFRFFQQAICFIKQARIL